MKNRKGFSFYQILKTHLDRCVCYTCKGKGYYFYHNTTTETLLTYPCYICNELGSTVYYEQLLLELIIATEKEYKKHAHVRRRRQ